MAKYRPIQIRIWKDPNFEIYNANMKLIFLYLCTNELTTESGIYAISTRTISQETSIPHKTVIKLLSNGLKNILYDFTNSCIFVRNFLKHSVGGSPDLIQKSINNNYRDFNTPLWNEFIKVYPEKSKGLQRVDKPLEKDSIEIALDNSLSNRSSNSSNNSKNKHLEYVMLTSNEHKKLTDKFGCSSTDDYIIRLNNYIGQIGIKKANAKYVSHYHTILNWSRKDNNNKKESSDELKPRTV